MEDTSFFLTGLSYPYRDTKLSSLLLSFLVNAKGISFMLSSHGKTNLQFLIPANHLHSYNLKPKMQINVKEIYVILNIKSCLCISKKKKKLGNNVAILTKI